MSDKELQSLYVNELEFYLLTHVKLYDESSISD